MNDQEFILRVTCPDSLGLVAKVSNFLNEQNLFIKDSAHYGDPITKKFFMRVKVISPNQEIKKENFDKNMLMNFSVVLNDDEIKIIAEEPFVKNYSVKKLGNNNEVNGLAKFTDSDQR